MASVGQRMSFLQKFSYSVGHVLNDLTASMWFSYMIIYFHQVKDFNNSLSGNLVLIGQISDAMFTPFIGYESDRVKGLFKMGKRKTWHFIGTICVVASFPFLFANCITCANSPDWSQFIYYAPFVVIFQFGWASVQINHLSLIPDLTKDEHERVGLNSYRYAFTVLSNIVVYGIAWLIISLGKDNDSTTENRLEASDAGNFRLLVFIIVGIGIVFSVIFHLGVREKATTTPTPARLETGISESTALTTIEVSTLAKQNMSWKCWLKEHQFYQVAVIYMCTRLVVNVSQVYLPMYISETIKLEKNAIAIGPLVVFISGLLTAFLMKPLNKLVGRKVTYALGIVFSIGACVWYKFVPAKSNLVYGAAVLNGIGGSTMLVTSLAMTADLIKFNTESGAFVYGAMSFTDKLSNGVAIALIQYFHPCVACCPQCREYYRHIMSYVPGAVCIIAFIGLLTLGKQTLGTRRNKAKLMSPIANGVMPNEESTAYESIGETDPLLRGMRNPSINSERTEPVYVQEIFYDTIDTNSARGSLNSTGVSEHFYEPVDSSPRNSTGYKDVQYKNCSSPRYNDIKPCGNSRSGEKSLCCKDATSSTHVSCSTLDIYNAPNNQSSNPNQIGQTGPRDVLSNKNGCSQEPVSVSPCSSCRSSRSSFLSIEDSDEHYDSFDENVGHVQSVGNLAKSMMN